MDDHSSRNIFHAVIGMVAKSYQWVPARSFKLQRKGERAQYLALGDLSSGPGVLLTDCTTG